jgi:hypothetical protein
MISMDTTLADVRLIELPQVFTEGHGAIVFYEKSASLPFTPKRVFYLYDIPAGESRGAHSHKNCHQLLVASSGSFTVELNDGESSKRIELNQPNLGLHIPPGIWASELNFSGGAICLVLASETFDEADYIRDFESFLTMRGFEKST